MESSSGKIFFRNGWLADVEQGRLVRGELLVEGDRIAAIAPQISCPAAQIIDLADKILAPGFIDLHTHLREPGYEYKETIASGAQAAAAGGFTTIACMPNTNPPLDTPERVVWVKEQARATSVVKVLPIGAISLEQAGRQTTDFEGLQASGAVAFSDDGRGVMSSRVMLEALQASRRLSVPIMAHEEDGELAGSGSINAGPISEQLGDPGIPAAAEYTMLARDLYLAELTGGHLHVCHVSAAESVNLIRAAKARGVKVTAEVTPHHLHLTDRVVPSLLGQAKVNPPLRSEADRQALLTGVVDGTIDIIATDHAPHASREKEVPLSQAAFGFSGLEVAFAVAQAALVHSSLMSLEKMLAALTCRPADILGLPQGRLKVGAPADLVVLDPHKRWRVSANELRSQGKNTPYLDQELVGKVLLTMVDGRIVYREG
ncbi:MAG: dihydroorotase [Firmicutes bacterium]|nr:dihydroorotase [Bacillota bacterium]